MQISSIDTAALQQFSRNIWVQYQKQCSSFEEVAQRTVEDFFDLFHSQNGEPEFALIRIFRTTRINELPHELQAIVKSPAEHYLALMGTVGVQASWCDRRQSRTRQVIPINQYMSPMFKGIFRELGFRWRDETGEDIVAGETIHEMPLVRYFHVEDVSSSTYIPDQEQFVRPYGIQSALAVGVQFGSKAAYVLIGFSMRHISPIQAEQLAQTAPYISTLLATFDEKNAIWAE